MGLRKDQAMVEANEDPQCINGVITTLSIGLNPSCLCVRPFIVVK